MKITLLDFLKHHPVRGLKIYPNGSCEVLRSFEGQIKPYSTKFLEADKKRGLIRGFSSASRKRLAWVADRTSGLWKSMITLTYGEEFPTEYKMTKDHLNIMLGFLRSTYKGLKYLWFMEFQKRGAVHFHIMINQPFCRKTARLLINCWSMRQLDVGGHQAKVYNFHMWATDYGVKGWENEKFPGGCARYAVLYAMKPYQKEPPKWMKGTGRFWGTNRSLIKDDAYEIKMDGETLRFIIEEYGNTSLRKMEIPPKYIIGLLPEDVSEWLTLTD